MSIDKKYLKASINFLKILSLKFSTDLYKDSDNIKRKLFLSKK